MECDTAEKHCFSSDEGDAWSLAYSNTDILYLEAVSRLEDQILQPQSRGRPMSRPITVIPPPSAVSHIQKPVS